MPMSNLFSVQIVFNATLIRKKLRNLELKKIAKNENRKLKIRHNGVLLDFLVPVLLQIILTIYSLSF